MIGRDGDNLVCPFECDVCSFFGLTWRFPNELEQRDKTLMILIRRAKLDAFWSRRSSTVARNTRLFKRHVEVSRLLGYDAYGGRRPVDPYADYGLRYALTILWESLSPGRFGPRVQFSTVRHVRGMGTNVESMWQGLEPGPRVVRRGATVHQERAICTDSVWMRCFMSGLQSRMGESLRQDMALTPLVVGQVLQMCEEDWNDVGDDDWERKRIIAEEAVFFVLTYVGGLRGSEVRKVVVTSLRRQFVDARGSVPAYVGLPLVGRFKSRGGVRSNIIVFVVQTTSSGIRAGLWLKRLIRCLEAQGIVSGWLYQDDDGSPRRSEAFRNGFYERLERAKGRDESLFGEGINIWEDYGPSRSGRRGANTQALKSCTKMEVELFFRWNTGGDETSHLPMHILYAEKKHLVSQVLKVSLAL